MALTWVKTGTIRSFTFLGCNNSIASSAQLCVEASITLTCTVSVVFIFCIPAVKVSWLHCHYVKSRPCVFKNTGLSTSASCEKQKMSIKTFNFLTFDLMTCFFFFSCYNSSFCSYSSIQMYNLRLGAMSLMCLSLCLFFSLRVTKSCASLVWILQESL